MQGADGGERRRRTWSADQNRHLDGSDGDSACRGERILVGADVDATALARIVKALEQR